MNRKSWLIRNDGKIFQTKKPIYISSPAEIISNAEWIYNNTSQSDLRENIIKFLNYNKDDIKQYVSEDFVNSHSAILLANPDQKLENIINNIINNFNKEFILVTEGSMFSSYGRYDCTGDLYFIINNQELEWLNLLWAFINKNKKNCKINTVSAIQDPYSELYLYVDNDCINHLDVNSFLQIPAKRYLTNR